jgi:hypothetical protein
VLLLLDLDLNARTHGAQKVYVRTTQSGNKLRVQYINSATITVRSESSFRICANLMQQHLRIFYGSSQVFEVGKICTFLWLQKNQWWQET